MNTATVHLSSVTGRATTVRLSAGGNEHSYILHDHYSNNHITQVKSAFSYDSVRGCDVEGRYE